MMNERDERASNTAAGERREDRREERLQSLFTAAYLPLDPCEACARRVAAVVAEREAQQARRRQWWSGPFGWGSAVSAVAAAALLIALGLTLVRWHDSRTRGLAAPSVVVNPRLPRNAPGARFLPRAPRNDRAPRMANLPPALKRSGAAVPQPPMPLPAQGTGGTLGKNRMPLRRRVQPTGA